jgi:hypothetical protein
MKEGIIHSNITIPADNQPAIISQPRKGPLNLIATFVTPELATIIILAFFVITAIRTNQFNTSLSQTLSQRVAIITPVGDQTLGIFSRPTASFAWHSDIVQRFFEQRDLVRGRRVQVVSQRNTFAVDHHHPLRSFAAFGLSDAFAPFFAGAKLPSVNASDQSSCPRWSSSERKALHAFSHTSCSSQSRSLLQQVEALGNCFGRSAQGAPVRSIHKIPSNTLRLSAQGLPPRLDFFGFGSNGSIFSHCACVNFHLCLAIKKTPFYGQAYISLFRAQV